MKLERKLRRDMIVLLRLVLMRPWSRIEEQDGFKGKCSQSRLPLLRLLRPVPGL
jgi:hypothetical protein